MLKLWNVFSDLVAFRSIFWTLLRVNTPDRMVPQTQLWIPPPEMVRRSSAPPDFDRDSYLADEYAESVVESDSDDYLSSTQAHALVHY